MRRPRRMLGAYGSAAALLALLIPGCALPIGRGETSPPPAAVHDDVPSAAGPTVEQVGDASWYGPAQDGEETASGETFDQNKLTAAHRTLPLGSKAVVTNLENGKSVEVKINDRGPYAKGRKIDLSRAAARQIGMSSRGVARVRIETKAHRRPIKKTPTKSPEAPLAEASPDTPVVSPQ